MIEKEGFVAMLDVLGFSERMRDPDPRGLDAYISTVSDIAGRRADLGLILFSDTIALYTYEACDASFFSIIEVASVLTYQLLLRDVPIRGAISHGRFFRSMGSDHGTVIAGRPIIEAHHFESQLQWIGVMLAPTATKYCLNNGLISHCRAKNSDDDEATYLQSMLRAARIRQCSDIPINGLSAAGSLEGVTIAPIPSDVSNVNEMVSSLKRANRHLAYLLQLAPDPRSQAKYRNSITWLRKLLSIMPTELLTQRRAKT